MAEQRASYQQRERAESFGAVALDYDRYRPGYPSQLIDDLLALHPASVLDIGCGTGKAARSLVARGLHVLGVEVDPAMAAVARGHGVEVEIGKFEQWDDAGRRFDLIISAQAWHWIEPEAGAAKLARLLRPGGTAALFWNHQKDLPEQVRNEFRQLYQELAPELIETAAADHARHEDRPFVRQLEESGVFRSVEVKDYPYEQSYDADEWVGMVQTHSDHLMLAPQRRAAVAAALRDMINRKLGGRVHIEAGTYCIWVRP
ncbi:MAG TPA: class I SAM-dependent methyltransferase [Jatrophihabitans sp.]|nr:class I SAM-dependent methyltransferase [Jatrophihabitans sp.]